MGGGTKKCKICNTSNAAALLFLCEGIFCRQKTVDWKMIHHYLLAGPNMLIKQKMVNRKTWMRRGAAGQGGAVCMHAVRQRSYSKLQKRSWVFNAGGALRI
jgi:hypothetical protein